MTGLGALVAGLLLLPLIFATVGSGPYGVWLVLFTAIALSQYSDLGVGAAIVYFSSQARARDDESSISKYLSAGLLWNSAATVVLVPCYFLFALLYVSSELTGEAITQSEGIWLAAIGAASLLSLFLRPFMSTLVGAGLMPVDQRNQLIATVVRVAGTGAICLVHPSIVLIALVEMLWVVLPGVLALVTVLSRRIASVRWDRRTGARLRTMLHYSVRSFTASLAGALTLQAGVLIAGLLVGPSAAAYYSAAFRVYTAARQVITWMVEPFRSALSQLYVSDAMKAERSLLSLCFAVIGLASAGSVVGILLAPWLTLTWLGSSAPVQSVALTLSVFLAGLAINSIHIPLAMASDSRGKPGLYLGTNISWLVLTVSLSIVLSDGMGIVGIAAGLTLPLLIIVPLNLVISHRKLPLDLRAWTRNSLAPAAVLVLPPILIAVMVLFVANMFLGGIGASLLSAIAYGVTIGVAVIAFRKRLPLDGVRQMLRNRL